MGYNLWGLKELDTTEQLSTHAYYTRAAVSPVGFRLWGRTESDRLKRLSSSSCASMSF